MAKEEEKKKKVIHTICQEHLPSLLSVIGKEAHVALVRR